MNEEQKKERTVADIQVEYSNLCTKAGHCQYQIDTLKNDLALINSRLKDLNLEAAAASKREAEAKQEKKEDSNV